MKKRSLAVGFVVMATGGLAASAVMATAQPAPSQNQGPLDSGMDPSRTFNGFDMAPPPSAKGDDQRACERAATAQARFQAGISTAQERTRALEHAKSLAATASMRHAIESGLLPACPPDIERGVQP